MVRSGLAVRQDCRRQALSDTFNCPVRRLATAIHHTRLAIRRRNHRLGFDIHGLGTSLDTHDGMAALAHLSRLSWKWRKRSSVKIAERTYEKRAQALHC